MEFDNGGNLTDVDAEYKSAISTNRLLHDIAMIFIAIIGICANIIIIYIIARFKQLRTVDYLYLANWSIADIGSLFFTIILYNILDYFSASSTTWCVFTHIATMLQTATLFFVILLTIDWCLITFFTKTSQIFRKFYKHIISGIWTITLLISIYSTTYCLAITYSTIPSFLLFIGLSALILLVIILQITRGVRKCLRKPIESSILMLTLPTSFIACWLLGFIVFIVMQAANLHPIMDLISEILIFGTSVVILGLLYRLNPEFQSCFIQVLKGSTKYENRIGSFDNIVIRNSNNINHTDCIQISFDNPKDELLKNEY